MAELVPERRFPLELARRARFRRIHRDDAAEADAERADHAGQTDRSNREVVVLRKDLDEDRAARYEFVLRRHRRQRLVGERDGVLLQHGRFVLVHAHDEIAVAHGDELVQRVHHREQVEDELVVAVGFERRLEGVARAGLVARAQQLDAEIGERAIVLAVERERAAGQLDGLVEPIVARGELAGDEIEVAVRRRDRQRFGGVRLEVLRLVGDKCQRGAQRERVEAGGIHRQCLVDRLVRFVGMARIGGLAGEK